MERSYGRHLFIGSQRHLGPCCEARGPWAVVGQRLAPHRVLCPIDRPPFDAAPFIHPQNVPKHAALLQREQVFAEERGLLATWVVAHDTPLHRVDLRLEQEQLDPKRKRWLSFHDQKTAGILGLMPLVKGLPVRLTDSVDRPLKLFKHRRGVIAGWTLHADEAPAVSRSQRLLDCGRKTHQRTESS
jgi:hypothetical protein